MGFEKLGIRALVTFLLGPLILLSAWVGGLVFFAVATIVVVLALHEFYEISTNKGVSAQKWLGLAAAMYAAYLLYAGLSQHIWLVLTVLLLLSVSVELFRNVDNPILNVSVTLAGILYIAIPIGLLPAIRQLPWSGAGFRDETGGAMVILIFLCIWICDSAAYIMGSRFGKHKLFPRVSPNKSVEGTAFGFLFAVLTAFISQVTFLQEVTLLHVLAVGAICGSFGQMSDLIESLFKRDAGVKDASNLIPGHGGVLDRFDSEIVAVPLVYFYLVYFVVA